MLRLCRIWRARPGLRSFGEALRAPHRSRGDGADFEDCSDLHDCTERADCTDCTECTLEPVCC